MAFTVTDLMISALPEEGGIAVDRADTADISTCEEATNPLCGDVPVEVPDDSTCEEATNGQCQPPAAPEGSTCEEATNGQCGDAPRQRAIGDVERMLLHRELAAALAARR